MSLRPILISGEPVLHQPAQPVAEIDDEIRTLVADMYETTTAAPGVGLAAPQVGVGLRVFVFDWEDDEGTLWRGEAINPELWISPAPVGPLDVHHESEGCLSLPGERFPLRRAERALLRATDLEGQRYELEASGWLARILQHEFDHLNGILYADRLDYFQAKKAAKAVRSNGWGTPGQSWLPGTDHLED